MTRAMLEHLYKLDLRDERAYLAWCYDNGFEAHIEKTATERKKELRAYKAAFERTQRRRATHSRFHKKPKSFLQAVIRGELMSDEIDRPKFKAFAQEIENCKDDKDYRASLLAFLLGLIRHDELLFDTANHMGETPYIKGLIKLHDRKALWLRPVDTWKPKSKNTEHKFGELTRHFFDQYEAIPRFMERVWLRSDRKSWRYRDWFIHLGRGHNLRTAKLPIPLTKKMAHHFLSAPDDYSVEQAIRWGQMKSLGAHDAAIHAVSATRLGRSFENEAFWLTVMRLIAGNPMLDPRQIGPLIDFIQAQKYEPVRIETAPGQWREEPPAQPGFSMSGRSVTTLLRQVEDWHVSLGHMRHLPEGTYDKAPFEGFAVSRGKGKDKVLWSIRQLRNAKDLKIEGESLRHCIASYHWSCSKGKCTIWSLSSSQSENSYERRQTIEVNNTGEIVQCRGLANRDPSSEEWAIVNAWAGERQLQISRYL